MKKNNRLYAAVAALATLALLAGCTSAAASNLPDGQKITLEQAAAIAYSHAGVDEAEATDKSYERDRSHYEIDFDFGGWDYEYDISLTGEILHSYKEQDNDLPPVTEPQPAETQPVETQPAEAKAITLEEAKAIAFDHAGVKESQARDLSWEKEATYYDIDFEYDGCDYEYHVSFEGTVIFSEKEPDRDVPKATESKPTEPKPTETQPTETKTITLEEAAAIAYAHAGVKESNAYDKSCERDDGCYEIEFEYDGCEYEYRISLQGKVLRSHKERCDDHHEGHHHQESTSSRISSDKALSIALNHAGLAKSDTREREVEWDDGCWEVCFQSGRTEYEYKISAAGKVLHHEKELDD